MLRDFFNNPMDPSGDAGDKGGGGDKPAPTANAPSLDEKLAALVKENEAYKEKLAAFEKGGGDLADKTRQNREESDRRALESKDLEGAITFNLQSGEFLKKHAALLPENVKDLFTTADKETYDSPIQKSNEIKSGLIQEFFAVQANHDLLTVSQKQALADFLKLTKDGKSEKAKAVFDNIFEPALEILKATKKAEEVQRARNGYGDDSDKAYKEKLMNHSQKHYLGVIKS
jgi:hypothetical protein